MRKSLDTRLIDNLNKRRPVKEPFYIRHIITENDIYKITSTFQHGKYSYNIYLNKLYTGVNDIGHYLEENFDINEIETISIIVNTLPNFYFAVVASNEIGDDIFGDYGINCTFYYIPEREMPTQPLLEGLSLSGNAGWLLENPVSYFINFNGLWIIGDTIGEAE